MTYLHVRKARFNAGTKDASIVSAVGRQTSTLTFFTRESVVPLRMAFAALEFFCGQKLKANYAIPAGSTGNFCPLATDEYPSQG